MSDISFFFEDTAKINLPENQLSSWLTYAAQSEQHSIHSLNYILCSDEYLYQMNLQYLGHDYYTDVITFDNSESEGEIEGDIFISLDRVSENARAHSTSFLDELRRICVHGLLHLTGYNDKSEQDKTLMTEKENAYLSLPQFPF